MPQVLSRFHEVEYRDLAPAELEEKCYRFMKDFTTTDQQAVNLEKMTRGQQNSPIWVRQREGRITATVAHSIKTLKDSTPRDSVLKKIMKYDCVDLSKLDSIVYGQNNEENARRLYKTDMLSSHENFVLRESGLHLDRTFALFAATPDGVTICDCCNQGLLEIKCSYKHRDQKIEDIIDNTFCLDQDLKLKKNHQYYTQIQFQMYVTGLYHCDFVVYTDEGIVVQRILYDPEFVETLVKKCQEFAFNYLVPEILQHKLDIKWTIVFESKVQSNINCVSR